MTAARHLASLFHREAKKVRLYRTASPADLYPHSITDTTATHNITHCNSVVVIVVVVVVFVVIFLFILLVLALVAGIVMFVLWLLLFVRAVFLGGCVERVITLWMLVL